MNNKLIVKGAREHNLKNIDVEMPRDKLVVVSGVSGSGKSSLVFDTLFAEGQRRYVESLSAYARQFLGRMDKPDVDYIEGLSPAISIEQKTTGRNPRSTVGTITEIYDYLRLLYARIGKAYCPKDGSPMAGQSLDQIIEQIIALPQDSKLTLLAPVVKGRKGEHQKVLDDAKALGFTRVRLNGTIYSLEEDFKLDKQKKHTIDIVIDRIKLDKNERTRLAEAVESALQLGEGKLYVTIEGDNEERFFSENGSCPQCGFSMPPLEPRLFSFNNPFGSCPDCSGLGITLEFDEDLIIPNKTLSFNQGAFVPFNPNAAWYSSMFEALAKHYGFSLDTPVHKLDPKL
jgi:excinuclease ABC subunit A